MSPQFLTRWVFRLFTPLHLPLDFIRLFFPVAVSAPRHHPSFFTRAWDQHRATVDPESCAMLRVIKISSGSKAMYWKSDDALTMSCMLYMMLRFPDVVERRFLLLVRCHFVLLPGYSCSWVIIYVNGSFVGLHRWKFLYCPFICVDWSLLFCVDVVGIELLISLSFIICGLLVHVLS